MTKPPFASRCLTLAVFLCLLMMASVPPALANSAALAWLGQQLQGDGHYGREGDIATPVQATAETLRAQAAAGMAVPEAGLSYLEAAVVPPATEYLSRALIARNEAGAAPATLLAALQANQNPDGGFGGAPGQASNALDTAFALEALAKNAATPPTAALAPTAMAKVPCMRRRPP